jgi:apolipoprotein N-acyltransferase
VNRRGALVCLSTSALSGLALALADDPFYVAPLQLVAFVPFILGVQRCGRWWLAMLAGGVLGTIRCCPFATALSALPIVAWFVLPLYVLLLHALFGIAVYAVRRAPAPLRSVAHVVAWVMLETVDAHLPMWGTALSLCAWWPYPSAIRFIQWTGPVGVGCVVVGAQSLVLSLPEMGRRARIATAASLSLIVFACAAVPARAPKATLRVAAVSWSHAEDLAGFEGLVHQAALQGARLVVSPEAAFTANQGQRDGLLSRLGDVAQSNRVYLAVGYIDREHDETRVAFAAPNGAIVAEYAKTHLVPLSETTRSGSGEPVIIDVDGVRVGAVICQDDNFSDVATRYAVAGAQILISPTFEMSPRLGALHQRNAMLRPIEGGFAYIRGVANGTSAVVSSEGRVIASYDHLARGSGVVVANAPYGVP